MSTPAADLVVVTLAAPDHAGLAAFGTDPWWLVVGKAVAVFAFLVLTVLAEIGRAHV